MKRVVNPAQVAHLFANRSQSDARNAQGNFYFRDSVIYSYRDSWPLAAFLPLQDDGRPVVLFNSETYSNTTTRHESHVRRAFFGHDIREFHVSCDALQSAIAGGYAAVVSHFEDVAERALASAFKRAKSETFAYDIGRALDAFEHGAAFARIARVKAPAALPAYVPSLETARDDDTARAAFRAAVCAENAVSSMAARVASLREAWQKAGNVAAAYALSGAQDAQKIRDGIEKHAKKYALKIPANLPGAATIAARIAKLEPLAAAERMRDHADQLRRLVRYCEAGAANMRTTTARRIGGNKHRISPAGMDRNTTAQALAFGGWLRCARANMVKANAVRDFIALRESEPAPGKRAPRVLREAFAELQAAVALAKRDALPILARAEKTHKRATLETAYHAAGQALETARQDDTLYQWRKAAASVANYLELRAHGADVGALRLTDGAEWEREIAAGLENAESANMVRTLNALSPLDTVPAAIAANVANGHFFAAQSQAQELQNRASAIVNGLRVIKPDAPGFDRAGFRALADRLNAQAAEHMPAILAGIADAVTAWRKRDPKAQRPQGYVFRLTADGTEIESSAGARVSINAGRRLWALIRATVESGRAVSYGYGAGPAVGPFRLVSISPEGAAVVGCHSITAQEARAFAEYMQWPPFGEATADDAIPAA